MAPFSLTRNRTQATSLFTTVGQFVRNEWQNVLLMLVGTFLSALANVLFMIPHKLAAGGLGGLSIIINHFSGLPVGLLFWVMNIPLVILGFFYLGRWHFLYRTLLAITAFSLFVDLQSTLLPRLLDAYPITDDVLLSALFAAAVGGIGSGLIFKAGSTLGSTGVVSRIIQLRSGRPLSQVYFFVDGGIILITALAFGWETALYAFVVLYAWGVASDYILDGPSRTRMAMIVTSQPEPIISALLTRMNRGVSHWEVIGGYSGQARTMITCTILRPERSALIKVVKEADPNAFISIGVGHQAVGPGF